MTHFQDMRRQLLERLIAGEVERDDYNWMIQEIERAIMNSDLGLNPQSDGEQVIINIPALTEDRRIQLVKQVKSEGEQGKISIHAGRRHYRSFAGPGA